MGGKENENCHNKCNTRLITMILIKLFQWKNVIVGMMCIIAANPMYAQSSHAVKAISRVKPDSISLRWAPTDMEAWRLGNQYGYGIIRYTLVVNNVLLKKPVKELLTVHPLQPLALPDWEPIAKSSSYGAIAAQALYGANFNADANTATGLSWTKVYQKSNQQDMRFSFALFAADMNKDVAKASGLCWVDHKVKKGHKYLYKIFVAVPELSAPKPVDTALVYVGADSYETLPKPAEFRVDFMDSTAVLSWNREVQQSVYVAYQIERSSDGGQSFQVRNKEPFVSILKDAKNPFSFYVDSTFAYIEHQYRILGINAFGEKGPYSDVARGMSKPSAQLAPQFLKYEFKNDREVKLSWQYDSGQRSKIQGFKVYRSMEHEGGYKLLSSNSLLPKSQLYFVDVQPLSVGYYQVVAIDASGKEQASFPILVQFEDKQSPKAPQTFTGTIDKQGQVKLGWTANAEDDLLGYYVYASNGQNEEYARVSPHSLKTPTFDTWIDLKTLTDSIYYEVLAVDKHYNESSRTRLALARPDIIPPAPVGIVRTEGTISGIGLLWYNSPSKDVKRYLITRMEEHCQDCEKRTEVMHQGDSTLYIDSTAEQGKTYQYSIQAEDRGGLRSEKMETIKVQRKKLQAKAKVHAFSGTWDEQHKKIKLNWQASGNNVKHWIIYRASQGERLAQYASSQELNFVDIEVETTKTYEYYLRPVFRDRTLGSLSTALIVKPE